MHDAGGTLTIEPLDDGLTFRVVVPYGDDEPPLTTVARPGRGPA